MMQVLLFFHKSHDLLQPYLFFLSIDLSVLIRKAFNTKVLNFVKAAEKKQQGFAVLNASTARNRGIVGMGEDDAEGEMYD